MFLASDSKIKEGNEVNPQNHSPENKTVLFTQTLEIWNRMQIHLIDHENQKN